MTRKEIAREALSVVLAFTVANFLWQLCFDKDWLEAAKITYFQILTVVWFVLRIK